VTSDQIAATARRMLDDRDYVLAILKPAL